jgi:hypothetical protein
LLKGLKRTGKEFSFTTVVLQNSHFNFLLESDKKRVYIVLKEGIGKDSIDDDLTWFFKEVLHLNH